MSKNTINQIMYINTVFLFKNMQRHSNNGIKRKAGNSVDLVWQIEFSKDEHVPPSCIFCERGRIYVFPLYFGTIMTLNPVLSDAMWNLRLIYED